MKAQEFLKEYEKQLTIIASCWEEIARLKDIAHRVTGCMVGDRVQSSGSKQKMADAVDSYSDIESGIKKQIAEAVEIQNNIKSKIVQLPENEYYVLHGVYVLGKQYKEIASDKNKSTSWATSLHGSALVNLQKILDAEEESVKK